MVDIHLEEISPEEWQIRDVYARFGLALSMAQVLEHGIVNLAVWTRVHKGSLATFEESETDSAKLFRQTMGTLTKTLLLRRSDIAHLQDLLDRAVELRNFFAHQYFRQRSARSAGRASRRRPLPRDQRTWLALSSTAWHRKDMLERHQPLTPHPDPLPIGTGRVDACTGQMGTHRAGGHQPFALVTRAERHARRQLTDLGEKVMPRMTRPPCLR